MCCIGSERQDKRYLGRYLPHIWVLKDPHYSLNTIHRNTLLETAEAYKTEAHLSFVLNALTRLYLETNGFASVCVNKLDSIILSYCDISRYTGWIASTCTVLKLN